MMNNQKSIAAYLFVQMYKEDENAEAPSDIYNIADTFINSCTELLSIIDSFDGMEDADIQFHLYEIGKKYYGQDKADLKQWFRHLYLLMMKQEAGPRWGTYIKCFGPSNFKILLENKLTNPFMYS